MKKEHLCLWCDQGGPEPLVSVECGGNQALVHASHRAQLETFCHQVAAAKWRFLGGIGASIFLGIVGQVLLILPSKVYGVVTLGVAAAVVAVTLLKYPFATPETIALIGVRRSILLTRSCGYVILIIAAGLATYGLMS